MKGLFLIVFLTTFSIANALSAQEYKYKPEGYSSSCYLFCFERYSGADNTLCDDMFSKAEEEDLYFKFAIDTERRIQLHGYWIEDKCETVYEKEVCYTSGYQAVWCLVN